MQASKIINSSLCYYVGRIRTAVRITCAVCHYFNQINFYIPLSWKWQNDFITYKQIMYNIVQYIIGCINVMYNDYNNVYVYVLDTVSINRITLKNRLNVCIATEYWQIICVGHVIHQNIVHRIRIYEFTYDRRYRTSVLRL